MEAVLYFRWAPTRTVGGKYADATTSEFGTTRTDLLLRLRRCGRSWQVLDQVNPQMSPVNPFGRKQPERELPVLEDVDADDFWKLEGDLPKPPSSTAVEVPRHGG